MAIREGAWDCPACGRERNRGPQKHCPGCGEPRAPSVPFYLPDDAPEVTDDAALAAARLGPDWACGFCGADNRADYGHCTGCGAARDGAATRPVRELREEPPQRLATPPALERPPRRRGCGRLGCGLLLAGLLALILFCRPQEAELTVDGFTWRRTAEVEVLATLVEEGWQEQVPGDARILDRRQEQRTVRRVQIGTETRLRSVSEQVEVGTESVKVGVRDLGNGYFEDIVEDRPVYETVERQEEVEEPVYREDPVFDVKVRYEVDRWRPSRKAETSGSERPPAWEETPLATRERLKGVEGVYTIRFVDPRGLTFRMETKDENLWRSLAPDQVVRARVWPRSGRVAELLGPPG